MTDILCMEAEEHRATSTSDRWRAYRLGMVSVLVFSTQWLAAWMAGSSAAWFQPFLVALTMGSVVLLSRWERWRTLAALNASLILLDVGVLGWADGGGAQWAPWASSAFMALTLTRSIFEALPWAFIGLALSLFLEVAAFGFDRPDQLVLTVLWFLLLCGSVADFARVRSEYASSLLDALERARVAERARAEFLVTMSHEIRTPLHGILGVAQLLDEDQVAPSLRPLVSTLRSSGRLLLGLLNNVLDLSKLEAGQLELNPVSTPARELVEQLAQTGRGMVAGRPVSVDVDIGPEVPFWLRLDPNRVAQVLGNLIGNAAKYTEQGRIHLRVSWHADRLVVEVGDTGTGIPESLLPTLFERYAQGDEGRQRGTGLGLALVQELVTRMDGEVSVATELGVGTTFRVELHAPACEHDLESGNSPRLDGLDLLLVDDHPVNRMVGRRLLESRGAHVWVADSGDGALRLLQDGVQPALTLMDAHMPGMDGFEATERIMSRWPHPVVLLSAGGPTEASQAEGVGMVGFIPKPMELDSASAIIRRYAVRSARPRQPDARNAPPATDEVPRSHVP